MNIEEAARELVKALSSLPEVVPSIRFFNSEHIAVFWVIKGEPQNVLEPRPWQSWLEIQKSKALLWRQQNPELASLKIELSVTLHARAYEHFGDSKVQTSVIIGLERCSIS